MIAFYGDNMKKEQKEEKKSSERTWLLVGAVIFLFMAVISIVITFKPKAPDSGNQDFLEFATCVADSGAKMYGAYWCPHCQNNKDMFGAYWDAIESKVYVECDPYGDGSQAEECINNNIQGYPTWIYANGVSIPGENDLNVIAQNTGCEMI